jgi:hypothetical protein
MDEIERRPGVPALQEAEGDMRAGALSMRLEVEEQHREALLTEEPRPPHQAQPVRADAVHQDHRAARSGNPA